MSIGVRAGFLRSVTSCVNVDRDSWSEMLQRASLTSIPVDAGEIIDLGDFARLLDGAARTVGDPHFGLHGAWTSRSRAPTAPCCRSSRSIWTRHSPWTRTTPG